ncbi:MAG: hypothetical protein Q7R44_00915, partial [bacterium]|nr:hypothetical protein [bacterium]
DIEHLRGLFKYMVQTTLNICEIIDNLNLDPRQKAELFNALSSALSGTIQAANELYFPNQQTSRPGSPRDYKTDAEALTKLASLFTEHSPRQS